jgi:hypothetical protein
VKNWAFMPSLSPTPSASLLMPSQVPSKPSPDVRSKQRSIFGKASVGLRPLTVGLRLLNMDGEGTLDGTNLDGVDDPTLSFAPTIFLLHGSSLAIP